jgi:Fe-S oxidoreductase
MLVAGKWEQFESVMRSNIASVLAAGASTVTTSCPACDMMWRTVYPEWAARLGIDNPITVRHYSELVADKIAAGEFAFPATPPLRDESGNASGKKGGKKGATVVASATNAGKTAAAGKTDAAREPRKTRVTWHDSCLIGRASGVYEPPRELIKANPNAEFVEMSCRS